MNMTKTRGVFAALAVAGLGLVLGGCDAGGDSSKDDVASLTREVKEHQRLNKALMERIDRLERKIDGHTEDIDRLSRHRVSAELAAADVAETSATEEAAAAAPDGSLDIARLLETEDGQAAVEKAMAVVQERREAERRERWVGAMIDRFAVDANLSDAQADDMRRIVTDGFRRIGDLWSVTRDGEQSPEVRAIQREEAMVKMEEIRQQTNDEVKAILSPDQYVIYEEQSARMRSWGRGGGGGPGRTR